MEQCIHDFGRRNSCKDFVHCLMIQQNEFELRMTGDGHSQRTFFCLQYSQAVARLLNLKVVTISAMMAYRLSQCHSTDRLCMDVVVCPVARNPGKTVGDPGVERADVGVPSRSRRIERSGLYRKVYRVFSTARRAPSLMQLDGHPDCSYYRPEESTSRYATGQIVPNDSHVASSWAPIPARTLPWVRPCPRRSLGLVRHYSSAQRLSDGLCLTEPRKSQLCHIVPTCVWRPTPTESPFYCLHRRKLLV